MRQPGNREAQLIALASEGLTDKQIGIELGISAETVASHWKRLLTKHGVRSRTELIARTMKSDNDTRIEELNQEITRLQAILDSRKKFGARQGAAIARLQSLMEAIDAGVAFKSPERRILFANRRLVEIFNVNVEPSDLVGQSCRDAVQIASAAIPDPRGFAETQDRVMDAAIPAGPITYTLTTGQIIDVSYVPIPLGDSTSHLWIFRDVTLKRVRQRRLEKYALLADVLADAAPDMILGADTSVVTATLARLGRFSGADRVWIYELLPDGLNAKRTYVWVRDDNPADPMPTEYVLPLGERQAELYRNGEPMFARRDDFAKLLDPKTAAQVTEWGVRAIVSAPILQNGEFVAYLGMATGEEEDGWDDDTVQLIRRFAAMLAAYRQKLAG